MWSINQESNCEEAILYLIQVGNPDNLGPDQISRRKGYPSVYPNYSVGFLYVIFSIKIK
jgi:hypothetical protein